MNGDKIDTAKAKAFLDGGCTCALYCNERAFISDKRGVAPLLEWLDSGRFFSDFSAVDKVVGKAAAFLYVLLGVQAVYAVVISESAERVLRKHGIAVEYQEKVAAIRNRMNTGFCPMEQAVWDIEDPKKAYLTILETLEKLKR